MRFRGKSIRRKIVALLLVPLVSLTGLWVFATYVTGRQADELMTAGSIVEEVGYPLEDAVRAVQAERRQTLVFLADPPRLRRPAPPHTPARRHRPRRGPGQAQLPGRRRP